jgi:flagellum-specific ATP synthase
VLERRLATAGHFPSIDVLESISRVTGAVTTPAQRHIARAARQLMAARRDVKELVEIGAYVAGTNPVADRALALWPQLQAFLQQDIDEQVHIQDAWSALGEIVSEFIAPAPELVMNA